LRRFLSLGLLVLVAGCSTSTTRPSRPENLCAIFEEKPDWYEVAQEANGKWGTPLHVTMAMMYQESSFRHDARPPMDYFLFIPLGRRSSAYGYAQAKDETWDDYKRETGHNWADRDDFADAIDFMGWYTWKAQKVNGVSKWDAYNQYLNYHEGWGGYRQGTQNGKPWLLQVARKVEDRAKRYAGQYRTCRDDL